MPSYRYRTGLMFGRWRRTRREALRDAVHSGFAQWAGPPWTEVKWKFPGYVKEQPADGEPDGDERS